MPLNAHVWFPLFPWHHLVLSFPSLLPSQSHSVPWHFSCSFFLTVPALITCCLHCCNPILPALSPKEPAAWGIVSKAQHCFYNFLFSSTLLSFIRVHSPSPGLHCLLPPGSLCGQFLLDHVFKWTGALSYCMSPIHPSKPTSWLPC